MPACRPACFAGGVKAVLRGGFVSLAVQCPVRPHLRGCADVRIPSSLKTRLELNHLYGEGQCDASIIILYICWLLDANWKSSPAAKAATLRAKGRQGCSSEKPARHRPTACRGENRCKPRGETAQGLMNRWTNKPRILGWVTPPEGEKLRHRSRSRKRRVLGSDFSHCKHSLKPWAWWCSPRARAAHAGGAAGQQVCHRPFWVSVHCLLQGPAASGVTAVATKPAAPGVCLSGEGQPYRRGKKIFQQNFEMVLYWTVLINQ